MVQKFCESLQISVKVNFRDKNFVITLNFRDLMLTHPFFSECAIEAKIIRATRHTGTGTIPKTIIVCRNRKSCPKIHCVSNFFLPPPERKTIVLALPLALHTSPYHAAAVTKFG